jgi:uncharacterized protein YtpQ (UPF0354 family)
MRLTVRTSLARALEILQEERAAARAIRRMPKPVRWEWAKPRLVPLLAGPRIDPEGESLVRVVMDPGVAVVFGLDLGAAFPLVDDAVSTRWESSAEQIREVATSNLERWAAELEPRIVRTATMSGHQIRLIQDRPGWASSIVLVPEELRRLFGDHDQIFAAPRRDTLLNFQPDIPSRVAGEIVVDFEAGATYPLMLDPFGLEDGTLSWGGADDWENGDVA